MLILKLSNKQRYFNEIFLDFLKIIRLNDYKYISRVRSFTLEFNMSLETDD